MREVTGVKLVAVMADQKGNEEYVSFENVPTDQRDNLEEELLIFNLMEHVSLAKKKLGDWDPIRGAISRLGALV